MAKLPRLTLAFLQRQPASAARALEALAPEGAAEVLKQVPVRVSAPVFSEMTSIHAARCAASLPPASIAAICESLPHADASALLRNIDEALRDEVLARLPGKVSRRFRRALVYAHDIVGAWVEPNVPALSESRTVSDARHLLSHIDDYSASHLPLVDQAQKYVGLLSLSVLLRASPNARLETLAWKECPAVLDSYSLATVAARDDWDETTLLPIVNHRGELLGGLSRKTLSKAMRSQGSHEPVTHASVLAHLMGAYLVAAEGVLKQLLSGVGSPVSHDWLKSHDR